MTHIQDRLSVDIASVEVFGGHASGRLDVNPGDHASLALSANAWQLDSGAFASEFQLPLGVSGPITLQAQLSMPVTMKLPVEDVSAAAGTFSIRFPAGGSIEGDAARTINAALAGQDAGWSFGGGSFPFAAGSIFGVVKPGGVDLKVQGESGGKAIGGALTISLPDAAVSGTLSATESLKTGDSDLAGAPEQWASSTKLILSGTAAALVLSPSAKPSLSN